MNTTRAKSIYQRLRALGPYLLIELLLPGGTLLALALWLADQVKGRLPQPHVPAISSVITATATPRHICPRVQPRFENVSLGAGIAAFQQCACTGAA